MVTHDSKNDLPLASSSDHRSLFDVFKCRMDVGNSPPEFSDRCLAARAPEAQLDGKQQVLVALAIGAGVRPELSRGQKVSWFLCFKLCELFLI